MEINPTTYYESMKRFWRRRKYQRLNGTNKRKMKIMRLGGKSTSSNRRRLWKIRPVLKLKLLKNWCSPLKLLVKFHDAYINMMIRLASNVGSSSNVGIFGGKRIPKSREVKMISGCEEVDSRLVFEIYKRLVLTGEIGKY